MLSSSRKVDSRQRFLSSYSASSRSAKTSSLDSKDQSHRGNERLLCSQIRDHLNAAFGTLEIAAVHAAYVMRLVDAPRLQAFLLARRHQLEMQGQLHGLEGEMVVIGEAGKISEALSGERLRYLI